MSKRYRVTLGSDVHGGRKGPFSTLKEAYHNGSGGPYRGNDGMWYTDNYGAGRNAGDVIVTHFSPDINHDGVETIVYMTGNHNETARIPTAGHKVEVIDV